MMPTNDKLITAKSVNHLSIKLPPCWTQDIELWLLQCEAQFCMHNIQHESTKFDYIIQALPPEVMTQLRSCGKNPLEMRNPLNFCNRCGVWLVVTKSSWLSSKRCFWRRCHLSSKLCWLHCPTPTHWHKWPPLLTRWWNCAWHNHRFCARQWAHHYHQHWSTFPPLHGQCKFYNRSCVNYIWSCTAAAEVAVATRHQIIPDRHLLLLQVILSFVSTIPALANVPSAATPHARYWEMPEPVSDCD